jgi:hypothetical protein
MFFKLCHFENTFRSVPSSQGVSYSGDWDFHWIAKMFAMQRFGVTTSGDPLAGTRGADVADVAVAGWARCC